MDAAGKMSALRRVDEQHNRKTALTGLPAISHVAVTLAYIVTVLSCGKYEPATLLPFAVYPIAAIFFGRIPPALIASHTALALPFIMFIGIFNPLLDTRATGAFISAGWLSFLCIVFKCVLTVSAVLISVCITGIDGICSALVLIRVPRMVVAQLSFTYRYIHVLGGEVVCLLSAHSLRAPGCRGVSLKQFGSMCGGLFLRSVRQAGSIYNAMRCRGFNGVMPYSGEARPSLTGLIYAVGWCLFFVAARLWYLL